MHPRFTRTVAVTLAIGTLAAAPATARVLPADPVPAQDLRNPDTIDYAQGRGTYNAPETVVVRVPQPAEPAADGIDWGDAGIGAAGLLGASLIGVGGALFVVNRRHGGAHRLGAQT